jgi:hypothetical protein
MQFHSAATKVSRSEPLKGRENAMLNQDMTRRTLVVRGPALAATVGAAGMLSHIGAGLFSSKALAQQSGLAGQPRGLPLPPEGLYHFSTLQQGRFLTAVNGGGLGGDNSGFLTEVPALHSDAVFPGEWEKFFWWWVLPNKTYTGGTFALQTVNMNYITAVNGGGMGGPNNASSPFHTDALNPSTWENFYVKHTDDGRVTLGTGDKKHFVTAVNGGGIGDALFHQNDVPIHTDATKIGGWEIWSTV